MTIGAEEQERAFGEWLEQLKKGSSYWSVRGTALMRQAFDAGYQRGLAMRGCCEDETKARES